MPDDTEKSQREIQTFCDFIARSELPINPCSVEKRHPDEPDILCWVNEAGYVAFELTEICDETIARIVNELSKQDNPKPVYMHPGDPARRILKNKRGKKYKIPHPVELLVWAGRTLIPPDQIKSKIERIFGSRLGDYQRVWFMGQPGEVCECVVESPEPSYHI